MTVVPFFELTKSTSGFSFDNILGKGGFATVYRARLTQATAVSFAMQEDDIVAVKVLQTRNKPTDDEKAAKWEEMRRKQLIAELTSMGRLRHKNISALLGHSIDGPSYCMIYEFCNGGSLLDRLQKHQDSNGEAVPVLSASERLWIAMGKFFQVVVTDPFTQPTINPFLHTCQEWRVP